MHPAKTPTVAATVLQRSRRWRGAGQEEGGGGRGVHILSRTARDLYFTAYPNTRIDLDLQVHVTYDSARFRDYLATKDEAGSGPALRRLYNDLEASIYLG